jgi:hypothetical protein
MAYSIEEWNVVKAYYECGLTLAEIVDRKEVRIKAKSQISRKAAREGWKKGTEKQQLVNIEVQTKQSFKDIKEQKAKLSVEERDVINELVNEKLAGLDFYQTTAREVVKAGVEEYKKEPTAYMMKPVIDGLKGAMQVEGLQPFFQNAPSTNIQNNVGVSVSLEERENRLKELFGGL